jgi:hypothetical protein
VKLQTSSPRVLFIGACWTFLVGFVLLGLAAFFTWRTSAFIQRSQTATGIVTALVPVTSRDSDSKQTTDYAPVFSFRTENGQTYTVTSSTSSNPPSFAVNEDVTVLYDPADPQQARIDSFVQLWLVPVILGSIGIISFIVGFGFVFLLRSLARRGEFALSPKP